MFILLGLLATSVAADTANVNITGVEGELLDNATAFLTIRTRTAKPKPIGLTGLLKKQPKGKKPVPPSASDLQRWHQRAVVEIQQALQPFGYYQVAVDASLTESSPGQWLANYVVSKGIRSQWREIDIDVVGTGRDESWVQSLLDNSPLGIGVAVDHRVYDARKQAWVSRFFDAGYVDARFVQATMRVNPLEHQVDVQWVFDTGPRYFFGALTIDQHILKPELVDRYHDIEPGEPFDTRRLIDLQLKLNNSNYFQTVSLNIAREDAKQQQIPVTVTTSPRKKRKYDVGVGYGTDTGPRITLGLETRRVNRRGHRYRLGGRASAIESSLQFEYDIPIKDVAKDRWQLYAQAEKAEVGDADATQYSVGVAREDDWGKFRRRIFANLERSTFRFGEQPSQQANLVYPGFTLSYDVLDNPVFVRRGYSVAATVHGGLETLGSVTDFASINFSGRGILPLGRRGRLLAAADAGWVEAKEFVALPPSQRLFLGGDRSVRGYGFQSISPENSAGDDIGGPRSLSFSVEADYQVAGNWGIAAFFDAGDVSFDQPTSFRKALGLGLRYRSPVGMIRFDLAHPLDDPDTNVRVHLSIGPDL